MHFCREQTYLTQADLPEGRAGSHMLPEGIKLNSDVCAILRFAGDEMHEDLAGVQFIYIE